MPMLKVTSGRCCDVLEPWPARHLVEADADVGKERRGHLRRPEFVRGRRRRGGTEEDSCEQKQEERVPVSSLRPHLRLEKPIGFANRRFNPTRAACRRSVQAGLVHATTRGARTA